MSEMLLRKKDVSIFLRPSKLSLLADSIVKKRFPMLSCTPTTLSLSSHSSNLPPSLTYVPVPFQEQAVSGQEATARPRWSLKNSEKGQKTFRKSRSNLKKTQRLPRKKVKGCSKKSQFSSPR